MKLTTKLWIGIGILIILSPLGLFLPEHFKAGAAWGEWGLEEIREIVGYMPEGLAKLAGLWNAPIPDYTFRGWEEKGFCYLSVAYIISATVGISVAVFAIMFIGRLLVKKEK
ncbi:MAG: cobalamin biosynthesis protein [Candidatus Omnitrophica bacterium]|nr:cobalamin biosynthesis protein [Candidatus Omnitrophota bacterium]MBU4488680.1 cobalamin biosynthesis protein [Candidatus Omnitrophota bacterium]MCG2704803.1 cobalamin biosynthesis protein [Candidatus Omnitrophota bacterium]